MELSDRNKEILKQVVRSYIERAEPVGSRLVAKRSNLGLSPATIRNSMADLEEAGLLYQPHTAAGRMPTEEGLRFFVQNLLDKEPLSWGEQVAIEKEIMEGGDDFQEILKKTAQLLASLTGHTAVVSAPSGLKERLQFMELVKVQPRLLLLVMVSEHGHVRNQLIRLEHDIPKGVVERLSSKLHEFMDEGSLSEVRQRLITSMQKDREIFDGILDRLIPSVSRQEGGELDAGSIFIDGKFNLFDEPEFSDLQRLRSLLEALEEKHLLLRIIDRCLGDDGIQILIGSELDGNIKGCGMVVAPYEGEGEPVGGLGVLGPMRMNYGKIVSIVEYIAAILSSRCREL